MVLKLFQQGCPPIPDHDILEQIGEGGMSLVYKARRRSTGAVVAVKVIAAALADDFQALQRFEQEFRVGNRLVHPNIVRVLDLGRDQDSIYLIMEYVDGPSLARRIELDGPLPEAEAVLLVAQVAQALEYAHRRRIIHRDVKPDNILIKADGQAKLTDFGLVKDIIGDRHLTEPLSTLGTAHFMAPEQYLDAKRVDVRSDVYALAATTYHAVTGKLPFGACGTVAETMQQIAAGALTPPRTLVPELSEEVEQAILRAMSVEPKRRPASCLEFVRNLKRKRKGRAAADRAKPAGAERRATARHPHGSGTSCTVDLSVHGGPAEERDCWPAVVEDLSGGGLALVLGRRLEAGTLAVVELPAAEPGATRSLQARVVHVRRHGHGHWRVGCELLTPLSDEEVEALL